VSNPQHAQRPRTKSISEVGSSAKLETVTQTFAHPLLICTGVKSAKFGLDFRPQLPLTRSHLEIMQHNVKIKMRIETSTHI